MLLPNFILTGNFLPAIICKGRREILRGFLESLLPLQGCNSASHKGFRVAFAV